MKLRSLGFAGLLGALAMSAVACGGNGTGTSGSSNGSGGEGASSSTTTGTGGQGTGGMGTGGMNTGGSGTGGMGTGGMGTGGQGTGGMGTGGGGAGTGGMGTGGGGAGTGGAGTGGGGTGGGMVAVEICGNGIDDDMDGALDCADTDCAMAASCGKLLINEIDYDQTGADTAEFIELYNAGAGPVTLDGVQLLLVNGFDGKPYQTQALTGTLGAGQYFVLANAGVKGIPADATVVTIPDNSIQNGAPDGLALYDTASKTVLDALSYEGAITMATIDGKVVSLVHGTATTAQDDAPATTPVRSMIRFPNGQSTGDDSVDWAATTIITPGASNQKGVEICNNMIDDDVDGMTDCMDTDCVADPVCKVPEVCNNGLDDDQDGLVDCADTADCESKVCGAAGQTCAAGACACPGGATEMACADGTDNDCDGTVDCSDTDCKGDPACSSIKISAVDFPVIAEGGTLVVSGAGFTGATGVSIGGTPQATFTVDNDGQITIKVDDATPIGPQDIEVVTPSGSSAPFKVTVIRLLINELDSDQVGNDAAEFVEISTGVPGVSLAGYALVFWNGSNNQSYNSFDLGANNLVADANGFIMVGNTGMTPTPNINFTPNTLQNGEDAVAIYQSTKAKFPNASPISTELGRLIDALVYGTSDPDATVLLDNLIAPAGQPQRVQVDENALAGMMQGSGVVSIQRCGPGRRDGRKYKLAPPTPLAANIVPACP
jgi:hypothetical protein